MTDLPDKLEKMMAEIKRDMNAHKRALETCGKFCHYLLDDGQKSGTVVSHNHNVRAALERLLRSILRDHVVRRTNYEWTLWNDSTITWLAAEGWERIFGHQPDCWLVSFPLNEVISDELLRAYDTIEIRLARAKASPRRTGQLFTVSL